jgi:pantothenate kinase
MSDIPDHCIAELVARIDAAAAGSQRFIVAIAGPPGSGKSTIAQALTDRLNQREAAIAALFPLDGFHFDDAVLKARGDLARKGAPHTFDVAGYRAALDRLRRNESEPVAIPLFDRSLELSRGSAALIEPSHRIVVTEGNYLLLDDKPWSDLARSFDLSIFIDCPEEELDRRLRDRWRFFRLPPEEIERRVTGNDMPNARLIRDMSRPADIQLL